MPTSRSCRRPLPSPSDLTVRRSRWSVGGGGEGERVGGEPVVRGQEPPPEELPGFGLQLVEVLAFDLDADDARRLGDHGSHPQAVPGRLAQRGQQAVAHQQGEHVRVEQRPRHLDGAMARQVGARQLVQERHGDGQVGEQVEGVPGLVGEPPTCSAGGRSGDHDQQHRADGRGGEPRQAEDRPRSLEPALLARLGPGDRGARRVHDDEAHHQSATACVPSREHVGADAPFQGRGSRHQGQQHQHAVARQHAADVGHERSEQHRAWSAEREQHRPPRHGERAEADRREHV